jgi:hypothetical protein
MFFNKIAHRGNGLIRLLLLAGRQDGVGHNRVSAKKPEKQVLREADFLRTGEQQLLRLLNLSLTKLLRGCCCCHDDLSNSVSWYVRWWNFTTKTCA